MQRKLSEHLVHALAGLAAAGLAACANGPAEVKFEEGPGAEVTVDGLHKVINSKFRYAWVKPSADFVSYTAIVLDPVVISYKRKPKRTQYATTGGNFALSERQMAKMKIFFRKAFVAELRKSPYYKITDVPGPAVLRLVPSIIDLRIDVPTNPPPGRDRIYATNAANMTLLLELHDSMSGEILARVADRRKARLHGGFELRSSTTVSNTDAIQRVFRFWAEILRARLDDIHALEPSTSLEG